MADDDVLNNLTSRMNLGGQPSPQEVSPIKEHRAIIFRLTVGEIKAAINKNPDHPIAKIYEKAIRGMLGSQTINVEQRDLEALLTNGTVEVIQRQEYNSVTSEFINVKTKVVRPPGYRRNTVDSLQREPRSRRSNTTVTEPPGDPQ